MQYYRVLLQFFLLFTNFGRCFDMFIELGELLKWLVSYDSATLNIELLLLLLLLFFYYAQDISVFLVLHYVVTVCNPHVGIWRFKAPGPSSDADMLRRLINCRIIIIIIISIIIIINYFVVLAAAAVFIIIIIIISSSSSTWFSVCVYLKWLLNWFLCEFYPLIGLIWTAMLVWRKGNISRTVSVTIL